VLLSRPDAKDLRDFTRLTMAFDHGFERGNSNLYYWYLRKHLQTPKKSRVGPPPILVAVEFNWESATKMGGGPTRFFDVFLSIYFL